MARHAKDDEGPSTAVVMDAAWEGERRRGGCFLALAFILCVLVAAGLGWSFRGAGEAATRSSRLPTAVETVTADLSPAPTVTRWRTRPPAAGKVLEVTPPPAPTVTRWHTRTAAPSPAPTVTLWRTVTPTPLKETTADDSEIPGIPDPGD